MTLITLSGALLGDAAATGKQKTPLSTVANVVTSLLAGDTAVVPRRFSLTPSPRSGITSIGSVRTVAPVLVVRTFFAK